MKINKTNVARLLDKAKIAYELIPYEVDEKDLSAVHVAASLGEDIEQVFKTLILHGDRTGYFVCVIPGEHEVDLKLAAKVSGNKKCDLIPMKEGTELDATGFPLIRHRPDAATKDHGIAILIDQSRENGIDLLARQLGNQLGDTA
mgnify:CR=1 FL=1